ncbi:putative ammonium transporter 2 [Topomyia yanbarensis]|uniref:putative ammonium transporter 2 n=1 Tax=Topomyia yanbarensis TaxID=2498891 RepID=UPI00273B07A2|nr:putative ammonium transporter 2 [Topomyia yanbarensis]XP_058820463.1 putative ammonium transporter 2 [Topomyia yanbarensis]XP_058820464.1 putative ammonium transporter 2 [Topomyia yanbarensis]XP_058820465.1 putative ammonium transporter 2 [Topomyia yanbarensis]
MANSTAAPVITIDYMTINSTIHIPPQFDVTIADAGYIVVNSLILITMQTGFALVNAGTVSVKNSVNFMMKNTVDTAIGGFAFWLFGFGLAYGRSKYTNMFIGLGDFFLDAAPTDPLMGGVMTAFMYEISFSSSSTTIASGGMGERFNFRAYCFYAFFNSLIYAIAAGWEWRESGFLALLGVTDIAGGGPVHTLGGVCSFAAAVFLGPRIGRFDRSHQHPPMSNAVVAFLGLFILWWAWLAFNTASSYGLSRGRWGYTIRAAVMTMLGSMGGGVTACVFSLIDNKGKALPFQIMNGVLASLVSVTGGCYLFQSWSAVLTGSIATVFCLISMKLMDKFKIDDPLYACTVHGVGGIWGLIAIGLFAMDPVPQDTTGGRSGLFLGGGFSLLRSQLYAIAAMVIWGLLATWALLWIINLFVKVRVTPEEEMLGADFAEHDIDHARNALEELKPLWSREVELSDGMSYKLSKGIVSARDASSELYKGNINAVFSDGSISLEELRKNDQSSSNYGN